MLSYSEFLIEEELIESYIDLVEEWSKHETWGEHEHENEEPVGDHKVSVKMKHDDNSHKAGHYSAEFSVNNRYSKGEVASITKRDSRAILHHVHKKISEFIHKEKPKAIHMQGVDFDVSTQDKKQKMYNHFAHHLARKHGGEASVTQDGAGQDQASVHFDRGY